MSGDRERGWGEEMGEGLEGQGGEGEGEGEGGDNGIGPPHLSGRGCAYE